MNARPPNGRIRPTEGSICCGHQRPADIDGSDRSEARLAHEDVKLK